MIEVLIVSPGMPCGPETLRHASLGGSETAAIMVAKEISKLDDTITTIFCKLPEQGRPDYVPSGYMDENNLRWIDIEQYGNYVMFSPVDLLIVARDPRLLATTIQSKKTIFWMHDLATESQKPHIMNVSYNFDEIWTVSEFHRQQVHKVLGYPLENIRATRNGIVSYDDTLVDSLRLPNSLLYAARPERGLEYLVRPGGIMERLPNHSLTVTHYANYPEHMMEYYNMLWSHCNELENVNLIGEQTQFQLRQLMREHMAYVYPTAFEETSCIIMRECIEQRLPVICTKVGALPETLKKSGFYDPTPHDEIGTDAFCAQFAETVKSFSQGDMDRVTRSMARRKDLYWPPVAEQFRDAAYEFKEPTDFSLLYSLIADSDILPAMAYLKTIPEEKKTQGVKFWEKDLKDHYKFVTGEISIEEHYRGIYEHEASKGVPERREHQHAFRNMARFKAIANKIAELPEGSNIIEYGCAEGPVILNLALTFPNKFFCGVDFVKDNIELCKKYALELGLDNVAFGVGSVNDWPEFRKPTGEKRDPIFDFGIIAEVLEHTVEPWEVLTALESHVKSDGGVLLTVPQGAWEWHGIVPKTTQWPWRAHIWHIDKSMIRTMLKGKDDIILSFLTDALDKDARPQGHIVASYKVDHKPIGKVDALLKAREHRVRQTVTACIITLNSADTIEHMLNSIQFDVQAIKIALGPSRDDTSERVKEWAKHRRWIDFTFIDVPAVEAGKFGFDDARNASTEGVETDWILWLDSDEWLGGNYRPFLKENAYDSYAICQHHFTLEPRGEPAQIDKPGRLYRADRGFKFFGKVHEHAEKGFNGGPGYAMVLANVDIGHPGYVDEQTRKARFERNFPLLEWDRQVNPERKLGKYLWMRDLCHLMRYAMQRGDKAEATRKAEEAVAFWEEHREVFHSVGGGPILNNSLHYYSQAMGFLNRGVEVRITLELEGGMNSTYHGRFNTVEQALELANKGLGEQFEARTSRYWG